MNVHIDPGCMTHQRMKTHRNAGLVIRAEAKCQHVEGNQHKRQRAPKQDPPPGYPFRMSGNVRIACRQDFGFRRRP